MAHLCGPPEKEPPERKQSRAFQHVAQQRQYLFAKSIRAMGGQVLWYFFFFFFFFFFLFFLGNFYVKKKKK